MTADRSPQKNAMGSGTVLSIGALIFAVLTLLFALFSLFLGNRMASLHREGMKAQKDSMAAETTAIEEMKSAVMKAKKDLQAEKAGSKKLRKQLDAAMQELKKTQAQMAEAHKTIDGLRAKAAAAAPSLPAVSQPAAGQQDAPAVTRPVSSGEVVPSSTPAREPTQKSSDPVAAVQEERAAQPSKTNAAQNPEAPAPAPGKPQPAIEESNIEVGPAHTAEPSSPKIQPPAMEATEPAATN
jgi:hypothetical protein